MKQETDVLDQLQALLGDAGMLMQAADCAPYQQGARYGTGKARAVLRPRTVAQAEQVLHLLQQTQSAFVVQGANTGLVAAATPDASGTQFIFSLERLKETIQIDVLERTATVSAGVRLSELNQLAAEFGLCFPIDLSADPCIGGMIATNTGGTQLIKYGDVRANLCEIDAWLSAPQAGIVHFGSGLRKNNTGLELKHLLCGTAGAYGVILRAKLRLHRLPAQRASALIVPCTAAASMQILQALENDFPEFLASLEGMSAPAMQLVFQQMPTVRNPFANAVVPPYALLLELVCSLPPATLPLETLLQDWLADKLEQGLVSDAIFGNPESLWQIRHSISEAMRHAGKVIAFDLCLPRDQWQAFRSWGADWLAQHYPALQICDFGHVADGGIHYNLLLPAQDSGKLDAQAITQLRDQLLDAAVHTFGGSFSAEHGIGPYNQHYYQRYTPQTLRTLAGGIATLMMPDVDCGSVDFG
jgi:FAD/FMN-containing dehydrogenase